MLSSSQTHDKSLTTDDNLPVYQIALRLLFFFWRELASNLGDFWLLLSSNAPSREARLSARHSFFHSLSLASNLRSILPEAMLNSSPVRPGRHQKKPRPNTDLSQHCHGYDDWIHGWMDGWNGRMDGWNGRMEWMVDCGRMCVHVGHCVLFVVFGGQSSASGKKPYIPKVNSQ